MIAKIGRSSNLYGALAYNNMKVEKENGKILLTNKIIETPDGQYSVGQLAASFDPYLIANRNTEKHTLHISLNPDPKDEVSDDKFREISEEYMTAMGYRDQPFVVFKHTDISREHIHIVSVCVNEEGRKISDKFEKRRSMNVCRDLETKHGLIPATNKYQRQNEKIFHPVNYVDGDVKKQIGSVIQNLPIYYRFKSLGEYNALLSLYNITAEKVEGEQHGGKYEGLVYFALNNEGEKVGHPFKSSLFSSNAGLSFLELHFKKSKEEQKNSTSDATLKAVVKMALRSTNNERDFVKQLVQQGTNVVLRRTDNGRIYGITFIDHNSKSVWNGSSLGKEFAANVFNDLWNNGPDIVPSSTTDFHARKIESNDAISQQKPHSLFEFLSSDTNSNSVDLINDSIGGLMPLMQGVDLEEEEFARRMKSRKKRHR